MPTPTLAAQEFATALAEKMKATEFQFAATVFTAQGGNRYDKIVQNYDHGKSPSVHAFVDRATGHILKPAGWARPAKGVRYLKWEDAIEKADPFGSYLYYMR